MYHRGIHEKDGSRVCDEDKKIIKMFAPKHLLCKRSGKTFDELWKDYINDNYFPAEIAKQEGFVDEIIEVPHELELLIKADTTENPIKDISRLFGIPENGGI